MPTARMVNPVDRYRSWPFGFDDNGTPQHVTQDEADRLRRVRTVVERPGGGVMEVNVFAIDDDVW